jgi:hypothetical protein
VSFITRLCSAHGTVWKVDSANFALHTFSDGRFLFANISENKRYLEKKRLHPQDSSGIHRVLVLMWASMRILVR